MQFYRVDGIAANEIWAEDPENCRATQEMARKINMLSDDFNRKLREKAYFFVTEANEAALTIGVITRDAEKLRDQLGNYLRALGVELKDTKREEIKQLLYRLGEDYPGVKERIFGAMQRLPLPEWGPDHPGRLRRRED